MQVVLNTEPQKAIYNLRLRFPSWTQQQIADELNVSRSLVQKIDKKRKVASLIQVPDSVRKRAYQSMEETADAIEMHITELEELKSKQKEIIMTDDSGPKKLLIDQTPAEKVGIIKTQIEARTKLNELRTIEEPIKVLDWIGTHKLSEITN